MSDSTERPWEHDEAAQAKAAAGKKAGRNIAIGCGGFILLSVIGVASCSALVDGGGDGSTTSIAGKYDQTWTQSYSSTTCAEWNSDMTFDQQRVAAADMLTSARNTGDGGVGLPTDSLVAAFRGGITTACVIDTMNIAEVGAGLYLTERARFAPS